MGDESWKTHTYPCSCSWRNCPDSVTYMSGSFYCLGKEGLLSCFNLATQKWKPVKSKSKSCLMLPWVKRSTPYKDADPYHFLEYGGSLIIAYMKLGGLHPTTGLYNSCEKCEILRFDRTDRVWVKTESLEGGAIFLGLHNIGPAIPAGDITKTIASRVYYTRPDSSKARFLNYGPENLPEERLDHHDAWEVRFPEKTFWISLCPRL